MDALEDQWLRGTIHDVQGTDDQLTRIAVLTELVRAGGNVEAEVELVRLRHQVGRSGEYPAPPQDWPPTSSMQAISGSEIPTVTPAELSANVLHNAIGRKSCILVRGLMPEKAVDELVTGIDQALKTFQRRLAGDTDASAASWFCPFVPEGAEDINKESRHWAAMLGTVFAADSPRNFSCLIDIFTSMGIFDLLTEYFGVRPVLTVPKTSFKRVPPGTPGGWHQDVLAFGSETRALNMWVALSPCGREAPGLALVPINPGGMVEDLPSPPPLVPISDATIDRLAAEGTPVQEPVFDKGDVLFFDTLLPHQTQQGDMFTQERYALECWFFSPTTLKEHWLPLHV